ncbi:TetR/AcrR family transcriptional regulator [Nocardia sp. NRRL S-836]|uniref:TetR/AcrR family transcriptional regulator n=1 Tax=Nocardia sp. NRRL S-836 TaxID=1519492 RepID=UPI0006AEDF04|nr:TetR/AcrR family transcriptional regulator [Nocardia sp. NRRL S-836]KOV89024.1 TetR family transcriptional regulator [Nocardia sp. NRRL S-836]
MGRWEPDARDRLVRAALDLFSEQGYDNTAVAQIAERAGLTKSTFFRHFRDKREVLFGGQDELADVLVGGIAGASGDAGPLTAVEAALVAVGTWFTDEQRAHGPQRQAVVEGNLELRERSALKMAGFAVAMKDALERRGVPELAAAVAAELGVLAFERAYVTWLETAGDWAPIARRSVDEVRTAAATLG